MPKSSLRNSKYSHLLSVCARNSLMIPTSIRWTYRFTNGLVSILFLIEINTTQRFKLPRIWARGNWRRHWQTASNRQRYSSALLGTLVERWDSLCIQKCHTAQLWRVNLSQFITMTSAQRNRWSILRESFMSSLFLYWTWLWIIKRRKLYSIDPVIFLADVEVVDESF